MSVNTIFIISIIVVALLGFLLGFGRSLKIATKGIFGIVIAVVACAMLGGAVKSIAAVAALIDKVNAYFGGIWGFLGTIHLGTVVYYICFFLLIQLVRIIIVRIICNLTKSENKGVRIVNSIAGMVFLAGFCFALLLLFLAILKVFEASSLTVNFLVKVEESFLYTLYLKNPIVL